MIPVKKSVVPPPVKKVETTKDGETLDQWDAGTARKASDLVYKSNIMMFCLTLPQKALPENCSHPFSPDTAKILSRKQPREWDRASPIHTGWYRDDTRDSAQRTACACRMCSLDIHYFGPPVFFQRKPHQPWFLSRQIQWDAKAPGILFRFFYPPWSMFPKGEDSPSLQVDTVTESQDLPSAKNIFGLSSNTLQIQPWKRDNSQLNTER